MKCPTYEDTCVWTGSIIDYPTVCISNKAIQKARKRLNLLEKVIQAKECLQTKQHEYNQVLEELKGVEMERDTSHAIAKALNSELPAFGGGTNPVIFGQSPFGNGTAKDGGGGGGNGVSNGVGSKNGVTIFPNVTKDYSGGSFSNYRETSSVDNSAPATE